MKISTALISVYDKSGLVEFARGLHEMGVRILSTGGTARALKEAGIPLTEVAEHTGAPEMMDGRVKTLHPKIHGGILCLRDNPEHQRQAKEQGAEPIDLVAVNLYPFREVVARPGVSEEEAVENIDIGGPSMVRSAAKNHRYVTIVTDPSDYARVLDEMKGNGGATTDALRRELAVRAFAHTAAYDAAIAAHFGGEGLPERLTLSFLKAQELRYGENPHQKGALYRLERAAGASVAGAKSHGGKDLSFNNLLDADAALELVREFQRPACVVVKHNNPCGAGVAGSAAEAFPRALSGDPVSAYGGIVAFNAEVDLETAKAVAAKGNFFEVVVAPGYAEGAIERLQKPKWGKKLRILEAPGEFSPAPFTIRGLRNGLLVQTPDDSIVGELRPLVGELTDGLRAELVFAMTVCKHVRSNAIVLARGGAVVGVGAGQMSRLDSAEIAVRKAGDRAKGAVAASDAFFPFPDALEVLMRAGVKAAVHPGGSIRDEEVAAAAKKAGVVLVTSGMRHFRH